MKELDSKQRAFVLYAAKILKCSSPEELDKKLQGLSEDELNNLVQSFDQLYNQQMENNTIMARLGSKLNYIQKLNNKCPEGYEIEYYQAGGNICTRCKQKGAIPMAAKKNGGVAKDIKAEIAKCGCKTKKKKAENGTVLNKCGGKTKKKKMQDGGDMTNPKIRPSQDHAWDPDIKRWVFRPAGDGKPQNRVLESSKTDSIKPTKTVTSKQVKKASENIKKHLNGGLIQKYKYGGPSWIKRNMDKVDFSYENPLTYLYNSIWHPGRVPSVDFSGRISRNKTTNDIKKVQDNTYLIPTPDPSHGDVIDNAGTPSSYITKYDNVLPEIVVEAPRKRVNPMGGGLYQWMIENGLQSLASFKERKRLATQYGIPNYIGTAQQNAELQEYLEADLRQAETSGGRSGLRKGLDY